MMLLNVFTGPTSSSIRRVLFAGHTYSISPNTILRFTSILIFSNMKLQLSTIALLFAVASTATPISDADAGAVPASLEKRGETCDILGNNVNCRSGPGTNYRVVTTFNTERQIYFSCYKVGESISGNE